jgi:SAM-dependent methyltransferase
MTPTDPRLHSAAAERNRGPILDVLRRVLPARGNALELACGTGQHAVHFAAGLPGWAWQPTDPDAAALASTAAWAADAAVPGLRAPVQLDVMARIWPVQGAFDAIFCANLLHISPWPTTPALMQGAARHLVPGGVLVVYGPFLVAGVATAAGNLAFDADLRTRDPAWGLRELRDVAAQAAEAGLSLVEQVAMPANNLTLVFRHTAW